MIIDTLDNLKNSESLNQLISVVVDYIGEHDLYDLAVGKHSIVGEDAYVNMQMAKGKKEDEAVIEYHRKMIDIQVPLDGEERYGYTPLADLPEGTFDVANDYAVLPGIRPQTVFALRQGQFVIFTPEDGHAPCISEHESFKKAVFKIKA